MRLVLAIILGLMLAATVFYLVEFVVLPKFFKQTEEFIQGSIEKQNQLIEDKRTQLEEQKRVSELVQLEHKRKEATWVHYYVVPENCQSYESDAHMVECINHKMRAKKEFEKLYLNNLLKPSDE